MTSIRTAIGGLVLLAACEPRGSRSSPAGPVTASDGGRGLEVLSLGSSANAVHPEPTAGAPPLPPLDGSRVQYAYDELLAGHADEARKAFGDLGKANPASPEEIKKHLSSPTASSRGLLRNARTCTYATGSQEACGKALDRAGGGSCTAGTLTTGCGQIAIEVDGARVLKLYRSDEASVVGDYLVTHSPSGPAAVLGLADLAERLSFKGEIVATLDGGKKLVSRTETPIAAKSSGSSMGGPSLVRVDVRVLDPATRKTSNPCFVGNEIPLPVVSRPTVRLLRDGSRLLVRAGGDSGSPTGAVTLCSLDPARVLARFEAVGARVWTTTADEKTLFLSGIPVPSKARTGSMPDTFTALVDSVAIDTTTGAVQRVRQKEATSDIPGRDMVLAADGSTLAVGSHAMITFFETHPLKATTPLKLEIDFGNFDSSYDLTPSLELLPDGSTMTASIDGAPLAVPGMANKAPTEYGHVWLVSLKTRQVVLRGTRLSEFYASGDHSSGFLLAPSSSKSERLVVRTDAAGTTRTRTLTAGEGVAEGQKLPLELAAMEVHSSGMRRGSLEPAEVSLDVAKQLASQLCSVGGLFVPKAACPPP